LTITPETVTGIFSLVNLRAHWDRVPVPGSNGQRGPNVNSIHTRRRTTGIW